MMHFDDPSAKDETETRQITAYLSVYEVTQNYGGPEEGGWYYTAYQWQRVSIPFRATQLYRWRTTDEDDREHHFHPDGEWVPSGPPQPIDFQTEVRLASASSQLAELYDFDGRTRYSARGGADHELIIERNPGERDDWPRPRYE